jgi:hypothetical protein
MDSCTENLSHSKSEKRGGENIERGNAEHGTTNTPHEADSERGLVHGEHLSRYQRYRLHNTIIQRMTHEPQEHFRAPIPIHACQPTLPNARPLNDMPFLSYRAESEAPEGLSKQTAYGTTLIETNGANGANGTRSVVSK